jgi:hypothetical protein
MVTVPPGTVAVVSLDLSGRNQADLKGPRSAYMLPDGNTVPVDPRTSEPVPPHVPMAPGSQLGVIFIAILVLVIAATNLPLRSAGATISVILVFVAVLALAFLASWGVPVGVQTWLDVRISAGGYFLTGGVLFLFWLVVVALFDQRSYVHFSAGEMRVHLEPGQPEAAFDTVGLKVETSRVNPLLHLLLGLGSGDLVLRTTGAQTHQFDLPNVLFLGRRVREIEALLRSPRSLPVAR